MTWNAKAPSHSLQGLRTLIERLTIGVLVLTDDGLRAEIAVKP